MLPHHFEGCKTNQPGVNKNLKPEDIKPKRRCEYPKINLSLPPGSRYLLFFDDRENSGKAIPQRRGFLVVFGIRYPFKRIKIILTKSMSTIAPIAPIAHKIEPHQPIADALIMGSSTSLISSHGNSRLSHEKLSRRRDTYTMKIQILFTENQHGT